MAIVMSASGFGSVRQCEEIVGAGRVSLNGCPVHIPAIRMDPTRDALSVDGRPVQQAVSCRYIIVHKPYRVLPCFTDPEGRSTLGDMVDVPGVYAVGRLDYDSEGLMLLTDDGWLNHRLTHPSYEHPKEYLVQVERIPDEDALEALRQGVEIKGQHTRPAEIQLLPGDSELRWPPRSVPIRYRKNVPTAWLRIVLREGRKRQIRHMTAAVGHPTLRLIRAAIGPIVLGDLPPGKWRTLTDEEMTALARMLRRGGRSRR